MASLFTNWTLVLGLGVWKGITYVRNPPPYDVLFCSIVLYCIGGILRHLNDWLKQGYPFFFCGLDGKRAGGYKGR